MSGFELVEIASGRRHPLRVSVTIGRAGDDDAIVLSSDAGVSSRHAVIEQREGGWYCADKGSRTGTFVNGAQIATATRLRAGDELRIGSTRFTFVAASGDAGELPFPLVVSELLVRTRAHPIERATAIRDAVERALEFLVAAELGLLASEGRRVDVAAGAREWHSIALRLASRVRGLPESPIRAAALALIETDDSPSRLAQHVAALIEWGDDVLAGRIAEDAIAFGLEERHRTLRELLSAFSPLAALSLVSRVNLIDADFDRRAYVFEAHAHDGPSDIFPVVRCETTDKLVAGWCYLVGRSGVSRAISLAPIVGVGVPQGGRKLEVGVAAGIELSNGPIELYGVTSGGSFTVPFVPTVAHAATHHE